MIPYFSDQYGNAASKQHEFGWKAEAAVEHARGQVATLIGADPKEIIFTSGATESINLALKGMAESNAMRGNHIVTVATEHKAVLDTCARLEGKGFTVSYLRVDKYGLVSAEGVRQAITQKTIIVSIMMANNEIGTIAPLREIAAICKDRGVILHTDATQAVGKVPVDVASIGVHLMSFSAHKMYGPKGIGALYVRDSHPRIRVLAQMDGGGHERGLRSGTLNVPAIVGFGAAAEIAGREMRQEALRIAELRDRLENGITSQLDETWVNGHPTERLPNNVNITFAGVKADRLMMDMKEIAVSSGSACSSASPEPSHVLTAIGLRKEDVLSSIRFGLGRFTTDEEIEYAIGRVVETVRAARKKMSQYQPTHA
jgi:cysteine desulfurase